MDFMMKAIAEDILLRDAVKCLRRTARFTPNRVDAKLLTNFADDIEQKALRASKFLRDNNGL